MEELVETSFGPDLGEIIINLEQDGIRQLVRACQCLKIIDETIGRPSQSRVQPGGERQHDPHVLALMRIWNVLSESFPSITDRWQEV